MRHFIAEEEADDKGLFRLYGDGKNESEGGADGGGGGGGEEQAFADFEYNNE